VVAAASGTGLRSLCSDAPAPLVRIAPRAAPAACSRPQDNDADSSRSSRATGTKEAEQQSWAVAGLLREAASTYGRPDHLFAASDFYTHHVAPRLAATATAAASAAAAAAGGEDGRGLGDAAVEGQAPAEWQGAADGRRRAATGTAGGGGASGLRRVMPRRA
jgi:hypothetical protein